MLPVTHEEVDPGIHHWEKGTAESCRVTQGAVRRSQQYLEDSLLAQKALQYSKIFAKVSELKANTILSLLWIIISPHENLIKVKDPLPI